MTPRAVWARLCRAAVRAQQPPPRIFLSSWKENDTFFFLLSKTCSGCGGGRRRRRNLPPSHSTVSLLPHCSSTPLFTVGAPSHTHAGSARLLCPIHSRLGLRLQTYTPHPLQHTAVSVCQIAQAQPVSSFPPPLHRSLFQTSFSTHHPRLRPGCVLYFLRVSVPVPPPPSPSSWPDHPDLSCGVDPGQAAAFRLRARGCRPRACARNGACLSPWPTPLARLCFPPPFALAPCLPRLENNTTYSRCPPALAKGPKAKRPLLPCPIGAVMAECEAHSHAPPPCLPLHHPVFRSSFGRF